MRCIFINCSGHDSAIETLRHGQEHLAALLGAVLNREGTIIMDVATVKADFDQYKADVRAAFDRLEASIAAGNPDQQALADLDTAIKGADTEANAEGQPAEQPPADGTGDTTAADGTADAGTDTSAA
jgi:hypothetical protein